MHVHQEISRNSQKKKHICFSYSNRGTSDQLPKQAETLDPHGDTARFHTGLLETVQDRILRSYSVTISSKLNPQNSKLQ